MSEKNIEAYTSEELDAMRERGEGKTDWKRVAEMKEEDIDLSDIPELDHDSWDNAELVMPEAKVSISIRVDREVVDYFREGGPGYQTRMNAVLKSFVEAHKKKRDPHPQS
jgi:uncharacterized protein (DUF4415 family)